MLDQYHLEKLKGWYLLSIGFPAHLKVVSVEWIGRVVSHAGSNLRWVVEHPPCRPSHSRPHPLPILHIPLLIAAAYPISQWPLDPCS